MTKKKDFNEAKIKTQAELMLPPEMKDGALKAWENCKGVCKSHFKILFPTTYEFFNRVEIKFNAIFDFFLNFTAKNYKDPCDRVYYTVKCNYEFDPANFKFA